MLSRPDLSPRSLPGPLDRDDKHTFLFEKGDESAERWSGGFWLAQV